MQTMTIEVSRLMEQEDRISALPDNLIHHILSLLPSTKQAIRTGVLSKQWLNKWTQVPVLIFDSTGMSRDSFITAVDNTLSLHECSKISTFHLHYNGLCTLNNHEKDPHLDEKICFAATKQVEDLSLNCGGCGDECFLPEFLFNATSLGKLSTGYLSFNPIRKVNWVRLKALNLFKCSLSDQGMEHVLSGSPLLELLELVRCDVIYMDLFKSSKFTITSKSLKKLVLKYLKIGNLEISCPNLVELSLAIVQLYGLTYFCQAIENVLSNSLLLESLMVSGCHWLCQPVIASQSLKRLVMSNIWCIRYCFEISCEKLEELKLLSHMDITNVKFRCVPPSLCVTPDFYTLCSTKETRHSFTEDILQQLQHIKELRLGDFIMLEVIKSCLE